jgi:APA family basic amino acid/polyamine antiporter
VPLGPYLIPGLSILSCLYIMKDLSTTTYAVFTVWMMLAIGSYFAYGIRHSRLNQV